MNSTWYEVGILAFVPIVYTVYKVLNYGEVVQFTETLIEVNLEVNVILIVTCFFQYLCEFYHQQFLGNILSFIVLGSPLWSFDILE